MNHTSRAGGFGAPLSVFLGRAVRSNLPNSQNRIVDADENIRKREERAEKWATKKGKQYNANKVEVGDNVFIKNMKSGCYDIEGSIMDSRRAVISNNSTRVEREENSPRSFTV